MAGEHKLIPTENYASRFPVGKDGAHRCPVCEKTIFEEYDSFDICYVCRWEDSALQESDPDYAGGANDMSLNQAREAYRKGIPLRKR